MTCTNNQPRRAPRIENGSRSWVVALAMLGLGLTCLAQQPLARAADDTLDKRIKASFAPDGCTRPEWPKGALEAKHAGTTTLALFIGEDGKVVQSKITKSSGYEELDEAARVSISKCRFNPGKLNGKPLDAWLEMQYVWMPE